MSATSGVPSHECSSSAVPHRKPIRLPGYDYAQPGTYFVTICTYRNRCLFGDVVDDTLHLGDFGHIAREEWLRSARIRPRITLDAFVVMPNHLHGIISLSDTSAVPAGTQQRAPTVGQFGQPTPDSLPTIVRGFKASVTYSINTVRSTPGLPVWQRGFYEEVVRNDKALTLVREYIANNPLRWSIDREC
jgi:REP element-mobilizing transposase RayT